MKRFNYKFIAAKAQILLVLCYWWSLEIGVLLVLMTIGAPDALSRYMRMRTTRSKVE